MPTNKVVINGETKIDLTSDTVTEENILFGYTAHGANGEQITGSCTFDSDTSDANATANNILSGKTAYVNGLKITGTAEVRVEGTKLILPDGLVVPNG